jgi:hypothetical protein
VDVRPKEMHMTDKVQRAEITLKSAVYKIPGMDSVLVRRDIAYPIADEATNSGALIMDLYYPPDYEAGSMLPAVVFVVGYSDLGAEAKVGCKFKEMESLISWSKLVAARGLIGVTYANREPARDLHSLLRHLRQAAPALGIDAGRIGLWASSGNSPLALSVLMGEGREFVKCEAFLYPFLLDLVGTTVVSSASETFKFVNPCAGKSVDDLPLDVPLLIVRAGREEFPRLNETIDRFAGKALLRNLPLTLVNHATGPHAFDLLQDSDASRSAIRQVLEFLCCHLQA